MDEFMIGLYVLFLFITNLYALPTVVRKRLFVQEGEYKLPNYTDFFPSNATLSEENIIDIVKARAVLPEKDIPIELQYAYDLLDKTGTVFLGKSIDLQNHFVHYNFNFTLSHENAKYAIGLGYIDSNRILKGYFFDGHKLWQNIDDINEKHKTDLKYSVLNRKMVVTDQGEIKYAEIIMRIRRVGFFMRVEYYYRGVDSKNVIRAVMGDTFQEIDEAVVNRDNLRLFVVLESEAAKYLNYIIPGIWLRAKINENAKTISFQGENVYPYIQQGEENVQYHVYLLTRSQFMNTNNKKIFRGTFNIGGPSPRGVLVGFAIFPTGFDDRDVKYILLKGVFFDGTKVLYGIDFKTKYNANTSHDTFFIWTYDDDGNEYVTFADNQNSHVIYETPKWFFNGPNSVIPVVITEGDIDSLSVYVVTSTGNLPTSTVGCYQLRDVPDCKPGFMCEADFTRVGLCTDIDECETNTHSCAPEDYCRNNEGSFKCDQCRDDSCGKGLMCYLSKEETLGGIKYCKDIDECESPPNTCQNLYCRNEYASYYCDDCRIFSNGTVDGCSESQVCMLDPSSKKYVCDKNECLSMGSSPCLAEEHCRNTINSYVCDLCNPNDLTSCSYGACLQKNNRFECEYEEQLSKLEKIIDVEPELEKRGALMSVVGLAMGFFITCGGLSAVLLSKSPFEHPNNNMKECDLSSIEDDLQLSFAFGDIDPECSLQDADKKTLIMEALSDASVEGPYRRYRKDNYTAANRLLHRTRISSADEDDNLESGRASHDMQSLVYNLEKYNSTDDSTVENDPNTLLNPQFNDEIQETWSPTADQINPVFELPEIIQNHEMDETPIIISKRNEQMVSFQNVQKDAFRNNGYKIKESTISRSSDIRDETLGTRSSDIRDETLGTRSSDIRDETLGTHSSDIRDETLDTRNSDIRDETLDTRSSSMTERISESKSSEAEEIILDLGREKTDSSSASEEELKSSDMEELQLSSRTSEKSKMSSALSELQSDSDA